MFNKIIRRLKLIYSASPVFHRLVQIIAGSLPYYYLTRAKVFRQTKDQKQGPFNLVIETSNFCNASCLMCPYETMERPKKVMEDSIFGKIVSRLKEENLRVNEADPAARPQGIRAEYNKIFLSGLGEPLSDQKICQRIRAIKELGFWTKLYTNASLLTREIAEQLVDLGVEEINISFNGADLEQYHEVMGLDFARTIKNIETLLEIRKEKKSRLPSIQISSIIIGKNEKDIKKHLEFWQNKVDSATVSLAHEWGGGAKINSKLKIKKEKRTYPCRSLWHTLNILSNGDFSICCRDYEGKFVLGNIMSHSFFEILQSPILKSFREANLKFSKEALPLICQQCNFPYQDGIEWYLPRSLD